MSDAADETEIDAAVERLAHDAAALEQAVLALRDSIEPYGGGEVRANDIAGATQSALMSIGRLGNVLEKAAAGLARRAPDAYLDFRGEQTRVDDEIKDLAGQVRLIADQLARVGHDAGRLVPKLGSIGTR